MSQHTGTRNTSDRILLILEECGEIQGTETLASILSLLNNKSYVIKSVRRLLTNKEISIIASHGGRGCKTIYKRNRNQPGLARNTR